MLFILHLAGNSKKHNVILMLFFHIIVTSGDPCPASERRNDVNIFQRFPG